MQLASGGPELTALDIVRHFATFYPRPRPAEEVLGLVGLTGKARSRISQLSGGQIRRLDVAFVFGLPSILLVLLGSIFGGQAATHGVTVGQLFTAGMIAGGIMATSFQYLGINIATERENGWLKRLFGTPMPRTSYFLGKLIQVLVCTVAETVLLVASASRFTICTCRLSRAAGGRSPGSSCSAPPPAGCSASRRAACHGPRRARLR